MDVRSEVYNLQRLFALREMIESLALSAPPTAQIILPATMPSPRRIGVLCGSFNPLTLAHTELAMRAAAIFQLDYVFFTLAKVTIDKEQATGMSLEDRLLLLTLYRDHHPGVGVALVNRGLYFEQAQAFRARFGGAVELFFLIGMDKLLQIFDHHYYQDREAALQQLFSLASLIVANREDMNKTTYARLLTEPENRPYQSHVQFFRLPTTVRELSATRVRQTLAAGQTVAAYVPAETATFLMETHAYAPSHRHNDEVIDAYAVRQSLLSSLFAVRSRIGQEVDFRQVMQVALSPSALGRTLRQSSNGSNLVQLIHSIQPFS